MKKIAATALLALALGALPALGLDVRLKDFPACSGLDNTFSIYADPGLGGTSSCRSIPSLVCQAGATTTPAAGVVPKTDGSGHLPIGFLPALALTDLSAATASRVAVTDGSGNPLWAAPTGDVLYSYFSGARFTVTGVQGSAVSNVAPANHYGLFWNSSTSQYEPGFVTGSNILDGTITTGKLVTGSPNTILASDGTNPTSYVYPGGVLSLIVSSGTAAFTLNSNSVLNAALAASASGGTLGIGIATPAHQLDIEGSAASGQAAINVGSTLTNAVPFAMVPNVSSNAASTSLFQNQPQLSPTAGLTTVFGLINIPAIVGSSSNAIGDVRAVHSRIDTGASYSGTITNAMDYYAAQGTVAGGTVTNLFGFYGNITAASNRFNFYAAGTAPNYFAGNVGIGVNTFGASAAGGVIALNATATAPTTAPAGTVQCWGGRTSSSDGDLQCMNEAGTVTRLTSLRAAVATQFDKTSDTALANVTGLTFNVPAGKTFGFRATGFTVSGSSGGIKFAIGGTATATSVIYEGLLYSGATLATQTRVTSLGAAVCALTAATAATCSIEGTIKVNAGGTLTLQFAQNASSGTASSVLVGSKFLLEPIN